MAHAQTSLALALIALTPLPAVAQDRAPAGDADTRYCMRIEALTGSRLEQVHCWTRAEWTRQGVDVDRDWPEEGIRTID
jgi:hypothetical protein